MTDDTNKPADDASGDIIPAETLRTLACEILDLAHSKGVPPEGLVYVFGKIGKALIDMDVAKGNDKAATIMGYMNQFIQGMGMTSVPVDMTGDVLSSDDENPARTLQ
jgi:hypothetical protein